MSDLLVILQLLMIVGALIAIETTNLLSSIICLGAVGFLLSIAFLLLGAPDIAITQVVVEILCLVILIRAAISRELITISGDREFFGMVVTVVLLIVLVVFSVRMFDEFPEFGQSAMERFSDAPSATYVEQGLEKTGAANIVTAILLDFRAYDTLGEATVLFCALFGALAILRKKARKSRDETDRESDEV
ncbi:MAG: DUF4040 domain-containing protein [Candidatus Latescibacteria bacterium]|nr:DUF4040 domain-containing protein [Candidatus Latescibacterota bacterium]